MDNCLFIGNGFNRCLEHSISWDNLLEKLAADLGVDYNQNIAMPLEYERIINACLKANPEKSDSLYPEAKKKIAEKLLSIKLPEDAIHKKISRLNINAIITTNYDFLLEQIYNSQYKDQNSYKKYLGEKTYETQEGILFYHPHGMASHYQSICLGYEHYMGIVEKIRSDLNTKENNKTDMMRIKQVLHGEKEKKNTWYERFYTSNIAIMGFGLTDCESDIWWLITHRASLYYKNYCEFRTKLKNNIVYYDIMNDIPDNKADNELRRKKTEAEQHNRHMLLLNEHVIVKEYYLSRYGGNYNDAYNDMINDLEKNGIAK